MIVTSYLKVDCFGLALLYFDFEYLKLVYTQWKILTNTETDNTLNFI